MPIIVKNHWWKDQTWESSSIELNQFAFAPLFGFIGKLPASNNGGVDLQIKAIANKIDNNINVIIINWKEWVSYNHSDIKWISK